MLAYLGFKVKRLARHGEGSRPFQLLTVVGMNLLNSFQTLDEMIDKAVPANIRLRRELELVECHGKPAARPKDNLEAHFH